MKGGAALRLMRFQHVMLKVSEHGLSVLLSELLLPQSWAAFARIARSPAAAAGQELKEAAAEKADQLSAKLRSEEEGGCRAAGPGTGDP